MVSKRNSFAFRESKMFGALLSASVAVRMLNVNEYVRTLVLTSVCMCVRVYVHGCCCCS